MKIQLSRRIICVFLLAYSFFGSLGKAEGTTQAGEVLAMHLWEGHTGILVRTASMINPDGCAKTDYMILRDSYPHYKELYVLLLSAVAANKQVAITVSGCHETFPAIKHIWMYK